MLCCADGCTSVLQPLDVSINKPFKGWLRAEWAVHIANESRRVDEARKAGDKLAKVKAPSKQAIVDWVVVAVEKLKAKQALITKAFVVTGIASALNGADDHRIRKDDERDGYDDSDSDSDTEDFYGFAPEDLNGVVSDYSTDCDDDE